MGGIKKPFGAPNFTTHPPSVFFNASKWDSHFLGIYTCLHFKKSLKYKKISAMVISFALYCHPIKTAKQSIQLTYCKAAEQIYFL